MTPSNHVSSPAVRWATVLIPGALLYFLPLPALPPTGRHLLAVFVATIIALVARPVPMGVSVVIAMTILALTGTVAPNRVLSGFSNPTVWLIFTAFLFARAVSGTGFGMRVAYMVISRFGRNALSLGYSISIADLILAPFVPSDTARGGGIIYPISRSLARAFDSEPGATAGRIGSFLMLVGFHSTYVASAMFLTGMAANPLIADFARNLAHVDLTWMTWFLAASVPGALSLILVPYLIYRLHPPEIRDTSSARRLADSELARMGIMGRSETWLVFVLVGVMAGWVSSPWHGIPNAFVALAGLSILLVVNVITWDQLLAESKAWDALIWFAPLLMMADALNDTGVVKILSNAAFQGMAGWHPIVAMVALSCMYLYVHYGFASMTAHITALYPSFILAMLAAGVHPMLGALSLAFFSNLDAGLTHFGTGSAPVYFGAGYVSQGTWWKLGFIISLVNITIWLGAGAFWWKALGLW